MNRDRKPDLVCAFSVATSGLRTNDTVATLRGRLANNAPIVGADAVRVIGFGSGDVDEDGEQ